MAQDNLLYKTDYINKPWTWVKRIFIFCLFAVPIGSLKLESEYMWLKLVVIVVLLVLFVIVPRKEMGICKEYLYLFDVSVVSFLTRKREIKLAEIESIRVAGIHSKLNEILDTFAPGNHGGYKNKVELTYVNKSSESFELAVYKDELKKIITIAKQQMANIEH